VADQGAQELAILKVLWEFGDGTALDIYRRVVQQEDLPYSKVQALLRGMENKGLVKHRVVGRDFIYTLQMRQQAGYDTASWRGRSPRA